MASRRKGRILAFQALYFWESSSSKEDTRVSVDELVNFAWLEEEKRNKLDESISVFSRALIAGTIEKIADIDNIIKKHLENWDISRISRVDLAVLRMSAYSLMFQKEIHASIVIDEAIGICREFGADDSYKFVNGVLDSISRACNRPACSETPTEKTCD
jgi:N utilization substance protein B